MDKNYGYFLSYIQAYNGDYAHFGNGSKEPISGYGTTLVRLGGEVIENRKMFHEIGLTPPLYYLCRHHIILGCV